MTNRQAKKGKPIPRHLVFMFAVYLLASLICFGAAIKLHHQAFTPPAPAGQASVLVFTQDRHAKMLLQANVDPSAPSHDTLSVIPQGQTQGPWLLVVQCPQIATSASSQSWL